MVVHRKVLTSTVKTLTREDWNDVHVFRLHTEEDYPPPLIDGESFVDPEKRRIFVASAGEWIPVGGGGGGSVRWKSIKIFDAHVNANEYTPTPVVDMSDAIAGAIVIRNQQSYDMTNWIEGWESQEAYNLYPDNPLKLMQFETWEKNAIPFKGVCVVWLRVIVPVMRVLLWTWNDDGTGKVTGFQFLLGC